MEHTFKKVTWPNQAAVLISHASENMGLLLRELLRHERWTLQLATSSIDAAVDLVKQGAVKLIIVDDTHEYPANYILRQLQCSPIAALTPTLVFLAPEHISDVNVIVRIGRCAVVSKPLTPDGVISTLQKLLVRWSDGYLNTVRTANTEIIKGNRETGLRMLTELANNKEVRAFIAPALALYYRETNNFNIAEKILLTALKEAPSDLGLLFALSDFYLCCAFPDASKRLLKGAAAAFKSSIAILNDLLQAELMLQNLDGAITILKQLHTLDFRPHETFAALCKTLYSEGRNSDLKKYLSSSSGKFEKLAKAWETETLQPDDEKEEANDDPSGDEDIKLDAVG